MKNLRKIASNGLIYENPTLRLVLGCCPTLALTTAAMNGLGMGIAVTVVLICSNLITEYQELMSQWKALLPRYQEILASLPEADAEVLREFEYLSKEMDYQKMQTAYRVGCQQK